MSRRKDGRIRQLAQWKEWRTAVFSRDGYRCMWCRQNGYLEPHHILPKSKYPKDIFNINNGITLCRPCHDLTRGKEEQYVELMRSLLGTQ